MNTPDYSNITTPSRDEHEAFCDHVIAVEQARKKRRPLLYKYEHDSKWGPRLKDSVLNWVSNDYAIAPQKRIVPWTVACALIGRLVKNKTNTCIQQIDAIMTNTDPSRRSIRLSVDAWRSPKDLIDCYVEILPDGTEAPCGTEVDA